MNALRDKILKALAGSTSKNPVEIKKLRKFGGDDPISLDKLLDELYAEHVVNRINGMKDGETFINYWLTGTVHPAQPFSISEKSESWPVRTAEQKISQDKPQDKPKAQTPAKMQQKTSIPSKQPTLNQPQEQNMVAKTNLVKGTGAVITEIVNANKAGINIENLIEKVREKFPGYASKKISDMTGYLHKIHKIERKGYGKDLTLHPGTQPKEAFSPVKAAKKSKPAKPVTVMPLANGHDLQCTFNLNGSLIISKGDQNIILDAKEALHLMQFANHQLAYANQTGVPA